MESETKTLLEIPSRLRKDPLADPCCPPERQQWHPIWPLLTDDLNELQEFIAAAGGGEIQAVAGVVLRLRKLLDTSTALALRRVAIKQSRSVIEELCSVCGEKMTSTSGAALFQVDSWDIVCSDCGHLLAPELHCLVSRSQTPF